MNNDEVVWGDYTGGLTPLEKEYINEELSKSKKGEQMMEIEKENEILKKNLYKFVYESFREIHKDKTKGLSPDGIIDCFRIFIDNLDGLNWMTLSNFRHKEMVELFVEDDWVNEQEAAPPSLYDQYMESQEHVYGKYLKKAIDSNNGPDRKRIHESYLCLRKFDEENRS